MNTLFLSVSINTIETITLPANIIAVEQTTVVVKQLLQDHPKTIFMDVKHNQLNTLLELTNVAPYELWYFNEKEEFVGKSLCLQNGNAPFQMVTQARFIALVPFGIHYAYVSMNRTKDKKFALSETYLPQSEPYAIERAKWTLSLFNLTDTELIETFNYETQKKVWIQARSYYLKCLQEEIRNRSFNSDILFEFNANGTIATLSLKNKVQLLNNTLEFKNDTMNNAITNKSCKTFTAQVTIGLKKTYTLEIIPIDVFKETLLKFQKNILEKYNVELSTKMRQCEIIFLGQDEPSMELEFIQYPKFPQEESVLKTAIIDLTRMMMLELAQNRVVIVFADETIMLEQSDDIDPNIQL